MTGRHPFRQGKCVCVCLCVCLNVSTGRWMLALQSHRFSFMLVIVSMFMYIREETTCIGPLPLSGAVAFLCILTK